MIDYIHENADGSYRASTVEEIEIALCTKHSIDELQILIDDATSRLNAIKKQCSHETSVDVPGFPWDYRTCVACGHQSRI
jgi:hypothetical protein